MLSIRKLAIKPRMKNIHITDNIPIAQLQMNQTQLPTEDPYEFNCAY